MSIPLRQSVAVARYLAKQRIKRNDKFPLLVELEPLFQCNLACSFCGKIQYPKEILKKRMPVQQALDAIDESGAPMVSIAGGEPLVHPEVDVIARELIKRKKFVFLCSNAILMKKKMDLFEPSPYFAWVVHLDGMRERHDQFVEREGIFDKAVEAIALAKERGFRVNTNTTFLTTDTPKTVRDVLDFLNDELKVDHMMISPAYAYEKAPDQEHFPGVTASRRLFSAAFADGNRKRWRLNHTPLFLDFLEGKADFQCTPVGDPVVLDLRLAAAVLPDVRRLHEDVQGADRDDGLVEVRTRQRPALRQLHGALRLRADGRARREQVAEAERARARRASLIAAGRAARVRGDAGPLLARRTGSERRALRRRARVHPAGAHVGFGQRRDVERGRGRAAARRGASAGACGAGNPVWWIGPSARAGGCLRATAASSASQCRRTARRCSTRSS